MPRTARPQLSEEELRSWFVKQLPLDRLLLGLRAVGFTAESIAEVADAPGRETVYAWSANRSVPTRRNAEQLDRLRGVVSWICQQADLGPGSVWLVLNGWPGGLDPTGPTGLELLANRGSDREWELLADALGMSVGGKAARLVRPASEPAPARAAQRVPAGTRRPPDDDD